MVVYVVVDSIYYRCLDKHSKVFLDKTKAHEYAFKHMMYVVEIEITK